MLAISEVNLTKNCLEVEYVVLLQLHLVHALRLPRMLAGSLRDTFDSWPSLKVYWR